MLHGKIAQTDVLSERWRGAAGWVTSGGPSPTLGKNIGLCYLPVERAEVGRALRIIIRNQPVEAAVVPTPFYKRAK